MYKNRNNCNNSIQYENKQKTNIFLLKSIDKCTSISYNKAKIRDKKKIKLLKKKKRIKI